MWSKCLRGYLKRIQKVILWGLLSAGCFALVFYLSDVPLVAAGYAALLSIICGLLIAVDFARYFQSVKKLSALNVQDEPVIEELPEAFDLLEEEYGQLVLTLHGNIREFEREYERSRQDLTDYYTLWMHQIKTPIFVLEQLLSNALKYTYTGKVSVFWADEPTGALDSKAADELMELFSKINADGQTILMVTHSTRAASYAGGELRAARAVHQGRRGIPPDLPGTDDARGNV